MTKKEAFEALTLIDEALVILRRRYAGIGPDLNRFRADLAQARELIDRAKMIA